MQNTLGIEFQTLDSKRRVENRNRMLDSKSKGPLIILFIALIAITDGNGNRLTNEEEILRRILDPENMSSEARAYAGENNTTAPTKVWVDLFLRSIDRINEKDMEYRMGLTFRMSWHDERLKYQGNGIQYATLRNLGRIWIPDLFFSNGKEEQMHSLIKPNEFARVHPSGQVLVSQRLSLTLSCPMDFKHFPMDTQKCGLKMASYGYTTSELILKWKLDDPVQLPSPQLQVPRFTLERFTTDESESVTSTGKYSCLQLQLNLKRELNHYILNVFVPSLMMVLISWTSFWIHQSNIVGRILVTLAPLLVLAMGVTTLNGTLPQVAYTKGIDVWTGVCLTFIFLSLLHGFTVNYLSRFEKQAQDEESKPKIEEGGQFEFPKSLSGKLDVVAKVGFPIAFLLFNLIYWTIYSF